MNYSTGWKAGAVNLSSDSRPPDANGLGRFAQPENTTLYEIGAKAKFHGGYLNAAAFYQAIKGFQSNDYTGTGYVLTNAGKESVYGFEIDSAYKPAQWLNLTGSVTYLDPKYDSFKLASCQSYDVARCPTVNGQFVSPYRDLSGAKPAGIPQWSASVSATFSQQLREDIGAYLRGEYDYTSPFQLNETIPPAIGTYGVSNVNASLGVTFDRAKLEVMLWTRNLLNDRSFVSAFPTVAQTGSYSGYPNQPRTFGATFRKRF